MTRYELLLFLHITAAIVWIGSGVLLQVLCGLAERERDETAFAKLVAWTGLLGTRMFMPASLAVLVFGVALVGDGPWSFDQLWIVLALVGFAATFATGLLVFKPASEKIAVEVNETGAMGPASLAVARTMLRLGRIDYVVLFLVVFDMVVKPTGDDVGVLVFMALAAAAGAAAVFARRAPQPAPAS